MLIRMLTYLRSILYSHMRLKYLIFMTLTFISAIPVIMLSYWVQETAFQKELAAVEDKHLVIARNLSRTFERYVIDTKAVFKHVGALVVDGRDWQESTALLETVGISCLWRVNRD
ncbi:MAG: hypothetical protein HRU05_18650, partial [Oceanospirillaceae bacterium]|nr:hypothetical protein [Oceanospirillaceae bacterium]